MLALPDYDTTSICSITGPQDLSLATSTSLAHHCTGLVQSLRASSLLVGAVTGQDLDDTQLRDVIMWGASQAHMSAGDMMMVLRVYDDDDDDDGDDRATSPVSAITLCPEFAPRRSSLHVRGIVQ